MPAPGIGYRTIPSPIPQWHNECLTTAVTKDAAHERRTCSFWFPLPSHGRKPRSLGSKDAKSFTLPEERQSEKERQLHARLITGRRLNTEVTVTVVDRRTRDRQLVLKCYDIGIEVTLESRRTSDTRQLQQNDRFLLITETAQRWYRRENDRGGGGISRRTAPWPDTTKSVAIRREPAELSWASAEVGRCDHDVFPTRYLQQ